MQRSGVSKFDLGLLNAYNPMYFESPTLDITISENKDGKKTEGSYLSCVTNYHTSMINISF